MNLNPIKTPVVLVQYIGTKERKEDNLTDSGTVWHGQGDVQQVTHQVWGKLCKHPGIWRLVDDDDLGDSKPPSEQAVAQVVDQLGRTDSGLSLGQADASKAPDAHEALSTAPAPAAAPAAVARKTATKGSAQ
jgi:hypothetical protein